MLLETLLFEMNVTNLDEIKSGVDEILQTAMARLHLNVPMNVMMLLSKRIVKAAQNDETGTIVSRQQVRGVPEDAPTWLRNAIARGDEVFHIQLRPIVATQLNHIVDWLAADNQAARIIKAVPEGNFLSDLTASADTFFSAKANAETKPDVSQEVGREIVMTFRMGAGHKVQAYKESSLDPDPARGPVVSFWAKLISKEALNREGQLMGHCVGSYCNQVEAGDLIIYSLRDAQNHPHATVELTLSEPPMINQIKGKGNKPPVGKYGPYIRDFLNDVGAKATRTGVDDLRGLGLLTKDGKYGTILEIGGNILETFGNGDTIRSVDDNSDEWYVEKSGTIPFQISITSKNSWNDSNRHLPADVALRSSVYSIAMNRQEPSKYPIYAKNMAAYLNSRKYTTSTYDVMGDIGLLYDTVDKKWGSKDELTKELFVIHGISVRRLGTNLLLFAGNALIAEGRINERTHGLFSVKVVETQLSNPALKYMRDVVKEYYEKQPIRIALMTDSEKNLMRDLGLFGGKSGTKGVPEDKSIFKSKQGEIRSFSHRLYFYDPNGEFLGSTNVGMGKQVFVQGKGNVLFYKLETVQSFGHTNLKAILAILSDYTRSDQKIHFQIESLSYNTEVDELGYVVQNNEMIPKKEIEFKTNVKGYTVEMEPGRYGLNLTIALSGDETPLIYIGIKDKKVERLSVNANQRSHRRDSALIADHRVIVAAALNMAKVKMTKRQALVNGLTAKNGKFAPQTDKTIIQFIGENRLNLGNKFVMKYHGGFTVETDNERFNDRFGEISYMADEDEAGEDMGRYRHGDTAVYLSWASLDKTELRYHMKKGQKDVPRDAAIKAAAKFMSFFHTKVEPYLSDQFIGPAADENDNEEED